MIILFTVKIFTQITTASQDKDETTDGSVS